MTVNSIRRPVTTPTSPSPAPVPSATLRLGSKGAAVKELQLLLRAKGYSLGTDGDFGPKTKEAVVAFQRSQGLTADGIVGAKSWAKLRDGAQSTADTFTNPRPQTSTTTTSTTTTTTKPSTSTTPPVTTTPAASAQELANAAKLAQAKELVRAGGSATQADRDALARAMQSLPAGVLEAAKGKVDIIACRGSVTDYMTELKGVRPRGWPPGATWDIVPGLYNPASNEVVVATIGNSNSRRVPVTGEGHGSADVVFHELAHGLDDASALNAGSGRASHDADFRAAYAKDVPSLELHNETYLLQEGDAGPQEAYAETFARYFRRDPTLKTELPGMFAYWQKIEAELAKS